MLSLVPFLFPRFLEPTFGPANHASSLRSSLLRGNWRFGLTPSTLQLLEHRHEAPVAATAAAAACWLRVEIMVCTARTSMEANAAKDNLSSSPPTGSRRHSTPKTVELLLYPQPHPQLLRPIPTSSLWHQTSSRFIMMRPRTSAAVRPAASPPRPPKLSKTASAGSAAGNCPPPRPLESLTPTLFSGQERAIFSLCTALHRLQAAVSSWNILGP